MFQILSPMQENRIIFGTDSEESCTMTPEIWEQDTVPFDSHAGSAKTKILRYLGVDVRPVQRIQKELDNCDYEFMTAWNSYRTF